MACRLQILICFPLSVKVSLIHFPLHTISSLLGAHTEVRNEWNIKVSAWVWSCRRGRSDDTFSTRSFLPSSESLHFSFLIPVTEAGWWGQELFHVSPIGRHVRQPHRCKLQLLASINMKARFILNPNVSYFLTSPILETVQPVDGQVFFTKYFPFQRFLTW